MEGIADIRDESDRDGMRVVIELKRDAQPQRMLQDLYRTTPLQTNFGVIMLAIEDGQPRQLPLRDVMQAFLNFREETLTRQYQHQLEKTEAKLHIYRGADHRPQQPRCDHRNFAQRPRWHHRQADLSAAV